MGTKGVLLEKGADAREERGERIGTERAIAVQVPVESSNTTGPKRPCFPHTPDASQTDESGFPPHHLVVIAIIIITIPNPMGRVGSKWVPGVTIADSSCSRLGESHSLAAYFHLCAHRTPSNNVCFILTPLAPPSSFHTRCVCSDKRRTCCGCPDHVERLFQLFTLAVKHAHSLPAPIQLCFYFLYSSSRLERHSRPTLDLKDPPQRRCSESSDGREVVQIAETVESTSTSFTGGRWSESAWRRGEEGRVGGWGTREGDGPALG